MSDGGEEVRPCPFCGGEALMEKFLRDGCEEGEPDAVAYAYACRSCASSGGWAKNPRGALRNWNMRFRVPGPDGEF